jgi:hypothetical protein
MSTSEFAQDARAVSADTLDDNSFEIPRSEYSGRLEKREQQLVGIRTLHRRFWAYLVIIIAAGFGFLYVSMFLHIGSPIWSAIPAAMAISILQSLTQNTKRHNTLQKIARFYALGVARLNHQWQGTGNDGVEFKPKDHLCASDLNLFGPGSLFEFLCTARTEVGRETLASWLLNPAECEEGLERQAAVAELRDNVDLREAWASLGGQELNGVGSSGLKAWVNTHPLSFPSWGRALAVLLPICLIGSLVSAYLGILGQYWLYFIAVPAISQALLATVLHKKVRLVTSNLGVSSFELALLAPLLHCMEESHFQSGLLKSLQLRLFCPSGRPFKQIRILSTLEWLLRLRQLEYFAMLASLCLWGTNLAILIEDWRETNGAKLRQWLGSLGRFEALLCFARYSYENPDHVFPLLKPGAGPLFDAEGLGHPLLDRRTCVRCDLSLKSGGTHLVMVSGSNMSGKSTLLRSVGTNAVLALAGAPVRARRLAISSLQMGCSIGIHDSLLNGKSKFYAEVERLKSILALSRSKSILFLLDELLSGTNSHDRYLGAKAVVEQLVQNGSLGLVTTHDLALTEIVAGMASQAINVHFEEQYKDRVMSFDYLMRSGVLARSNGLVVMASLGLLPRIKTCE